MKKILEETYDAVVVGAGHAGCEAALALARLGFSTALFTVSVDSIALMPCNPNVGGSSKGHLVREVDALGGEMGKNIDATFIQSKMLNKSKGPAVHSLRAQADKKEYSKRMRRVLEETENISIKQAEVTELLVENNILVGVRTYTGAIIHCKVCVLCTGTYLKAKCITGEISTYTGPNGLSAANHLSDSLTELGIKIRRFKTGTPARIDGNTVDFSKMEPQYGDEKLVPFSFTNDPADIEREQVKCYLTYTNEKTHEIIRDNLDRSPLYSGMIKSTGPRYCPSIEDKVVRFADKNRHQVFIEPEGLYTSEVYIGGMSSSMPEDVQYEMYRSVKGLENARIVRNAYAIEYDCIDSLELKPSLECTKVEGLFSAGQANGSSGYEEAAAQGIIAGINAARKLQKKDPIILDRSQAYIGVLIDDLVTKGTNEPYRMMTSRAEYRLILRQDNADLRLTPIGYEVGLISKERYDGLLLKDELIQKEMNRMEHTSVGNTDNVQELLKQYINLDDVEVKRKLPDTLQIICIPSEVKCSIQTDGGYLYISNGNRILEINQPEPKAGTVVIKGCTVEQPEKGKYLSELHVSDIDRLRKLQEILGMIEFPDITSIDISNPLQTDITYQNRIVIQIQSSDDMEYLLQAAKKIIQEDIGVSETGRIFYVQSTQSIHFLPEMVE